MNYKKNLRYFNCAKLRTASYICFVLAAICVAIIVLVGSWMGSFSRLSVRLFSLSISIAPIAFIAGLVCFSLSMSDREYDNICTALVEPFKKYFCDFVTESMNKKASFGRVFQSPDLSRLSLSSCFLFGDGILSRRGHDSKYRTSEYAVTACLFDKGRLFIGYQINGITHDKRDEFFGAYKIEDIESIEITEPEKTASSKKHGTACIKLKSGEEISFPQAGDAEFDRIISSVKSKMTNS